MKIVIQQSQQESVNEKVIEEPQKNMLCVMHSQQGNIKDFTGVCSVQRIITSSQIPMVVDLDGQFTVLSVLTFNESSLRMKKVLMDKRYIALAKLPLQFSSVMPV